MMRGKWLMISVLAIGAGIGIGALSMRRGRQVQPGNRAPDAAVIASANQVTLTGTIRPQHVVSVGAKVQGNIETFMADVGQEVFQGQVLARIGAGGLESKREAAVHAVESGQDQVSKAEAAVLSARAEASRASADAQRSRNALDRAQKTYARQQTLHNSGATPRLVYEKAEQEYEAELHDFEIMDKAEKAAAENVQSAMDALAGAKKTLEERNQQLEEAQGALEAAELRAPIDGLIVGRKGEAGKPAEEAGDDLFTIATDIYALEVVLEPMPDVVKRIRPGHEALVIVPDLQTGGMPGDVKDVTKDGRVIVEFASSMPAVKPGMKADVRLKLE
jgi:multidrug efflux pump subunit AcrA (membrane-fusion protein)